MNVPLVSVIALAMTTTGYAGPAEVSAEPAQTIGVSPQKDDYTPMTRSERLGKYVDGTLGPKAVAGSAAHAGLGQIRNVPKEWGGGASGFGARMGASMAQHALRQTLQHGAAYILHEDNRYRRCPDTGFWKRTKYAVVSSFLTRKDNGRRGFGFSKIGSAGGAAFISRAALPRSIATVGSGASSFGLTIAADVGINMVHEFWPQLKHCFGRL